MRIYQRYIHRLFYFALLIVLVSLSACELLGSNRMNCSLDMLSMLKLQLPSATKPVSESCSIDINPICSAMFTLAPVGLAAFQQTTSITDWKTDQIDVSFFKDKVVGLKSLLSGKYGNGIISEEVLINTSNPEQFTVFFVRSYVD